MIKNIRTHNMKKKKCLKKFKKKIKKPIKLEHIGALVIVSDILRHESTDIEYAMIGKNIAKAVYDAWHTNIK